MVQIDRSTPPELLRVFRERVGCSQEQLSAELGLGENAVYRYEQAGAPRWVAYALLGLAVARYGLSLEEARALTGVGPPEAGGP
jgi:transcriptional regulator with XRE-family HTH domain